MRRYEHILAATDFSELGDRAVERAASLALSAGAQLTLLHVVDENEAPSPLYAHYMVPDHLTQRARAEKAGEAALRDRIPKELIDAAIGVVVVVRVGRPADAIVSVIREHDIDLVVLASHGRRGVQRLLLGSVTEMVVRETRSLRADVLVVT
jgi:nucleotide-binding universal stress UspA family protein